MKEYHGLAIKGNQIYWHLYHKALKSNVATIENFPINVKKLQDVFT